MKLIRLLMLVMCALVVGCGGGVSDTPVEVEPVATPVKAMLESVAESGELGSGSIEIREALEGMKASGDAKADELLTDLDELEGMGNPKQVKEKAAEMAGKL